MKYTTTLRTGHADDTPPCAGQYLVKYFVDAKWQLAEYKPLTGMWVDTENGCRKPEPLKWVSLRALSTTP